MTIAHYNGVTLEQCPLAAAASPISFCPPLRVLRVSLIRLCDSVVAGFTSPSANNVLAALDLCGCPTKHLISVFVIWSDGSLGDD